MGNWTDVGSSQLNYETYGLTDFAGISSASIDFTIITSHALSPPEVRTTPPE